MPKLTASTKFNWRVIALQGGFWVRVADKTMLTQTEIKNFLAQWDGECYATSTGLEDLFVLKPKSRAAGAAI